MTFAGGLRRDESGAAGRILRLGRLGRRQPQVGGRVSGQPGTQPAGLTCSHQRHFAPGAVRSNAICWSLTILVPSGLRNAWMIS